MQRSSARLPRYIILSSPLKHALSEFSSMPSHTYEEENLHSFVCLCHRSGISVSTHSIYNLIQACAKKKDVEACRRIHSLVISITSSDAQKKTRSFHVYLIHAFASCGCLLDANLVFMDVNRPSECTWSAIISAHIMLESYEMAFFLYDRMLKEGFQTTKSLFFCVLKARSIAGDLKQGKVMHDQFIAKGIESDVVSGTRFVDFYARCGALKEAQRMFDRMDDRNIVSWGALLAGYVQHECGHLALELYEEMQKKAVIPDESILSSSLKACASIGSIRYGFIIHDKVFKFNFESNIVLGNSLIDMYAKCGSLVDARKVFETLPNRSVVSWASMLAGHVIDGDGFVAFDLYMNMEQEGITPTKFVISSVLKACGQMCSLYHGKLLHSYAIELGLESNLVVSNGLIDMYIKCRSMSESYKLFNMSIDQDEVTLGSIMSGYVQDDKSLIALQLFEKMQWEGKRPNTISFSCALQACGRIMALKEGMVIHCQIIIQGVESDSVVGSSVIDMYAKCGTLAEAIRVFDCLSNKTLTSWGALVDGCATLESHSYLALELFGRMIGDCVKPNIILYSSALKACLNVGTLAQCHSLHADILISGLEMDVIAGNTLVNIYIKNGSIDGAHKVFDGMSKRDVVTWNSLIYGYAEKGNYDLFILELYHDMTEAGIIPDRITFLCILKACGSIKSLCHGRLLHSSILMCDVGLDISTENALIDMYSRCGSIEDAEHVFANISSVDVVSFGTMIAGYVEHGNCSMVNHCLQTMRHQGTMPDAGILSSILTACSQIGQVPEAHRYFLSMREDHGVILTIEHFNCMADVIARTGHLSDAKHFLQSMPSQGDGFGWLSLLSACGMYGNKDLAQKCFEQAVKLEPDCASGYVLLSNLFSAVSNK